MSRCDLTLLNAIKKNRDASPHRRAERWNCMTLQRRGIAMRANSKKYLNRILEQK